MATLYETLSKQSGSEGLMRDIAVVVVGSLVLALSAKITIPFYPVPLSMQTLAAIGLGLALGPVRGGAAVLAYLAEGAVGLPVFAGTPEKGIGLAYMMGPTGGFLAGFFVQAIIAGLLARRGWGLHPVSAMAAGLIAGVAIYPTGLVWLGMVIGFDKPLLALGLFPFILGDIVKALLAALAFPLAWKLLAGERAR